MHPINIQLPEVRFRDPAMMVSSRLTAKSWEPWVGTAGRRS